MDLLDSTITTIAAPTISSSLHGGPGLIKWLGANYQDDAEDQPCRRGQPGCLACEQQAQHARREERGHARAVIEIERAVTPLSLLCRRRRRPGPLHRYGPV